MKKITFLPALFALLQLTGFAQCPSASTFSLTAVDTTYYAANGQNNVSNIPSTYNCNATPFYVYVTETGSEIHSPCIKTEYNLYYTTLRNRATEQFYENGSYLGCVGPTGCFFPIGGTVPPLSGLSIWSVSLYGLDGTQPHSNVFSKTTGTWNNSTITNMNCWNNATLTSTIATPFLWQSTTTSFTTDIPTSNNIGSGVFTISPAVASPGFFDFGFGYCYANPSLMTPGTYTITYTFTAPGCAPVTKSRVFTIANPYNAGFTAPGPLCSAGSCVNLTTSGTAGGTWSGTGVSAAQFCPATSGAGSWPVTYTVGITATCGATQTNTVTVISTPTLTAAPSPTVICAGQSAVLTANGASSYTWSANAGSATTQTVAVSPGSTTTYTVTGANSICTNSTTVALNVNALPVVTATSSPVAICAGGSATLTAGGASTYTWSANEGGSSNNPTSVSPGANTTYTVTGTDNNGCVSSGQVSVTINPTPTLAISPASATICAGTAASCTVSGATSYTWSANAGGGNGASVSVSPTTNDSYTVTGESGGCTSQAVFNVSVTPLPTLTVSSAPVNICTGDTATLSVSGATTFTWSANAGGTSAASVTVAPASNATYTVAGTQNGCTDSTTITVNVGALPVVSVSASDTTICSGQSTTLTASGATSYTWLPAGSGSSNTVSPGSSMTYTLIGDNGGCSDSTTFAISVNASPTVTATASSMSVCAGTADTIVASGATTYTWSTNAGSATTSSVVVAPTSSDTYTVISQDVNGCSDTAFVSINVSALPSVTVSSGTICAGQQTATLTANGASTYSWSTSQSTATITVSPSSNTSYTVTGTDNNGCSNQAVASVVVNQPPVVAVTPANVSICNTASTTLTASGAMIYTWTPTSGLTPPIGGTVTANPSSTTSYTVTGLDLNGCFGSAAVTVSVNPLPAVTATVSPGTICSGSTATLTASGANTFTWSANASSATSSTTAVTPGATDTYTVTGTDVNGCTNSATIALTVNPTPTLQAVANVTACSGSAVSAINFNASAGSTVNWTNTNTNVGIGASGSGNINGYTAPSVAGTETAVVTATPVLNGCTGASQSFTVTINPKPTITGGTPDTARCGLPNGSITGATANGNGPLSYQWSSGGNPVSGETSLNLSNVPAGSYNLQVTDANGCSETSAAIIVPGTPSVTAAFVASPVTGAAPLPVSFTNTSVGATAYSWNFGNGSGSAAVNPSITYQTGGSYVVTLTASNAGCVSTYTATILVDQSISLVVPNIFSPNGDLINDEFGFIASGITQLSCDIYNRWGQKVKSLNGPTDKWDGRLDNGHLAAEGTYYYVVVASSYDGKPHNFQGSLTIVK